MKSNNLQFYELVDIVDIKDGGYSNVVDIQVEEDESFVLANGIISHNSAVGGLAAVRDPNIIGGLPLKGKVLNTYEETPAKVLANKELADIMNSLGIAPGIKAIRKNMRYGKIYIATDMDPDGANIASLLVNFFYKFWPELFDPDNPFIYLFQTPFIIADKGKERKYWYAHNVDDFDPKEYKGWSITRAKGLGTLVEEDWQHSLDNPVIIPIVEDGEMKKALKLLFKKTEADFRKIWMGI